ncbi:hypothetical protein F7725_011548, partial [Dissostichus mawsoni]
MKTLVAALALCPLYLPVYQALSIDMDKKIEEMEARLTKTEKELMDHKQMTELEAKLKDTEKQVEDLRAEVQGMACIVFNLMTLFKQKCFYVTFQGQRVAFGASSGIVHTNLGPFNAAITVTYKN